MEINAVPFPEKRTPPTICPQIFKMKPLWNVPCFYSKHWSSNWDIHSMTFQQNM
jgi:hypothetical protein